MRVERPVRQRGGILVLFALSLVVLFSFVGLVIDLGTVYAGKTELQNAADASALAGAKKLNGTAAGVTAALQAAKDMALLNKYRFSKAPVTITDNDVWIGSCRDDSCFTTLAVNATTDALAAGKYFLKVDTGTRDFDTTFMRVANISTTSARAVAVAGRSAWPIAPIAICALDETQCPDVLPNGECGFTRGLTYDLYKINHELAPSGVGAGDHIWLDPVATNSSECVGNTNAMRPFMCQGKVNRPVELGGTVYTNTGMSNALLASLDSRFGDYDSAGQCDPATAPPDVNVMGYVNATGGKFKASENVGDNWQVVDPTGTAPTMQSANITSLPGVRPIAMDRDGVRWTYTSPRDIGYPFPNDTSFLTSFYPASGTPYSSTSGSYFQAPPPKYGPGKADRRVLDLIVLHCTTVGGNCRPATVKGVGKFFMTRKSSPDNNVFLEFSRFIDPSKLEAQDVRLYR